MKPYRGLTKDGKMVYGWYVKAKTYSVIIPQGCHVYEFLSDGVEVIPESVAQQVGCKDKNGKEIYFDSDVVEYTFAQVCDEHDETTVTGIVVLDLEFTNSLCVKTKNGALYHFTASECRHSIEIIPPEEKSK